MRNATICIITPYNIVSSPRAIAGPMPVIFLDKLATIQLIVEKAAPISDTQTNILVKAINTEEPADIAAPIPTQAIESRTPAAMGSKKAEMLFAEKNPFRKKLFMNTNPNRKKTKNPTAIKQSVIFRIPCCKGRSV